MGILLVVIIWAVVLSKAFDYSNDSKELRKKKKKHKIEIICMVNKKTALLLFYFG